ncbi:hypothetical protein L208DRAFT_1424146 [Tricholoma matsutake]|nr:hypothetical protein L208DRAFT_1424146 [Tricholoma matsutake 945]
MEIQLSLLLHIGYIPSYKPKNPRPVPKLLEDAEAWEKLVHDVEEYIKSSKAKNQGKGIVKPFSITIIDTSGPPPKEAAVKKGSKKKASNTSGEGDEGDWMGELKDHELLQLVEKEHHCASCDKACIVLNSSDHYVLSNTDLATWVVLLKRYKATISEPPAKLKLDVSHQQSAKKTLVAKVDVAPSSYEPPAWMQPLMMMFGVQALQFQGLCHTPAAVPMEPQPIPQQPAVVPAPALLPTSQVPSTPATLTLKWSAEFDIEPEDSLELVSWLEGLNADTVRGKFNLNYGQYGPALAAHGLLEVNDLLDLMPDKLAELGGMVWGTANRILKFAVTNYQKIVEHTKCIRLD